MELQRMFVTLALKADEFKQGLGDVEGRVSGLRTRLGGALSGVAAVGQAAFFGIGAAAVGGLALAGNAALNMNAQLETSTLQFTTLMGDADKATAHVASLFDFAANTPFETGPIIDASLKLQTFGGEALNTIDNMTLVGDAAAAVGAPIDEVAFWVGRLYSNLQGGQPFGEAAMRLQELGIMTPQVRTELESMQETGASGTEIFGAFQTQMGAFAGAMEAQAGTWTGLTSTIKDQLGLLTAEALKPFFDIAKEGLAGLAAWLSSPEIQTSITNMATGFASLIEKVGGFITGQVIPFVQEHGKALQNILVAIGVVILASVIPAIVSMALAMAPIILVVAAVAAGVALLRTAWENNWGGIQEKVRAAGEFIKPILENIKNWIVDTVIPAVKELWEKWTTEWWPAIQKKLSDVWAVVQPILEKIKTFIMETVIPAVKELWEKWTTEWWPTIQTVLENVWTIIKGIFEEVGRWINDNIVPWVEFLREKWVDVVWPAIQGAIEGAWEIIQPIWEAIRKWAAETIPPIIEALKPIFETVMSGISAAIQPVKDLWDAFKSAVEGFWNWIKDKVFNFQIHIPDLPDWAVPGSPLPIHTAWLNFADDMPGIGADVAQGFDTITDSVEALADALDPVNEIYEGIDGLIGFGDKVGGLASGFANHFERLVTDPMKARLDELTGVLNKEMPDIAKLWQQVTGTAMTDWNDPAMFDSTVAQLYRFLRGTTPGSALNDSILTSLEAMKERNALEDEYMRQQERLLALEKARADLDFLKQQMELLTLMQQHHIPIDALQGVGLGLGADPGQLMDIMVSVMEQIVRQTSFELNSLSQSPVVNSVTPGTQGTTTYNVNEQTINGGQHIYMYDKEESYLEEIGVLLR